MQHIHPRDLSAALSHPDQWCPFLAAGWRDVVADVASGEPLVSYEARQGGWMPWAAADWWAGCFDGWRVNVCVYATYKWRTRGDGKRVKDESGWRIIVCGNDDDTCSVWVDSYESARAMIQCFPLVLIKEWSGANGFTW